MPSLEQIARQFGLTVGEERQGDDVNFIRGKVGGTLDPEILRRLAARKVRCLVRAIEVQERALYRSVRQSRGGRACKLS